MLGGVLATINSLPRTVPIVHGAQGCGRNLSSAYAQGGYYGGGYCNEHSIPSSNVDESDIIFGGAETLAKELAHSFDIIDADLFVITTACMTDIIGDDVKSVLSRFPDSPRSIFLETGGFKGDCYYGYRRFIEELFLQYIPRRESASAGANPPQVNLLGLLPGYDPFFRGDLEELARLLGLLGATAATFLTPDQTLAEIRKAGAAKLNVIFNRAHGADLGRNLRESHGIDYWLADLPVGAKATGDFLREIARRLDIDPEAAERVARNESRRYYDYVERLSPLVVDFDFQNYAVVVANSTNAFPYASYLDNELGWLPTHVYITDQLSGDQRAAMRARFEELTFSERPELVFETDTQNIQRHLETSRPQFLSRTYYDRIEPLFILGSTLEYGFAESLGGFHLSVSHPVINRTAVARGYAGYNGGLNLLCDLSDAQVAKRV
jgi:nitrogenase molybdenum-iron protein beta chain